MYKINNYVVYKRDVCQIINIKTIHNFEYYVLKSTTDNTLIIDVPVNNEGKLLRKLVTKEEITSLIDKIKFLPTLDIDGKNLEDEYKKLMQDGNIESLVVIIKTTYLRNKIRTENKKKVTDNDQLFFELAEKYLYNEIAYALNKTYDEAKEYIVNALNE